MNIASAMTEYEAPLRVAIFLAVFVIMAAWEVIAPRRRLVMSRGHRWVANLGILIVNTALVRAVFPAAAVGIALFAEARGVGLLHTLELGMGLQILLALVALDLAIYLQHVMFHAVPLLWRLHRVHHADLDIDVTTGTRFHPVEMLMSMAIKAAAILVIGAPALAVLVFEIALNVTAMFNHSNARLPGRLDAMLRWLIVTPDMHRVHHSIRPEETHRNFGFNLPWWDRILGTYQEAPRDGHEQMTIGIPACRDARQCATFFGILKLPFATLRGDAADKGDRADHAAGQPR
jgi:sterol desaturase/sphingolipid hydroxylase (fatty acid hydroxylase superfamily)